MLMRRLRFSKLSWLFYLVPLAMIAAVLFLSAFFIRYSIERYLVSQMAEHAEHISVNYMNRLANSVEASDIINDLIDQKLLVAGRALVNEHTSSQSNDLAKMAEEYEIDVVYIYNGHGEIYRSIDGEYIGWKAPIGHPVHNFMLSGDPFMVEDIRQDTESMRYYKYAYARASDGSFIQLGMAADRIQAITEKFTMDYYIDALGQEGESQNVFFVDSGGALVTSSSKSSQLLSLNSEEISAIRSQIPLERRLIYDGKEYYRSLVPVFVNERYSGTLIIDSDMSEHNNIIRIVYTAIFSIALVIFIVLAAFAISVVKRNRKLIRYAYYDALTGLPNIYYLKESSGIITSLRTGKGAVLLLDIVNFRKLNMLAGREAGDDILKQLARRLRNMLPDKDSLFRLSEDRFIICRHEFLDDAELVDLCEMIEKISSISYSSISEEIPEFQSESDETISVKIGVLKLTESHRDIETIIKDLEILIEYMKSQSSLSYGFFNQTMRSSLEDAEQIKRALKEILGTGCNTDYAEFNIVFQPQYNLAVCKTDRYEALSRLNINNLGYIPPPRFIEIAEKNQLIIELGRFVLTKSCEFLVELEDQGFPDQIIAVNVSAIELFQDSFAANLLRTVRRFGLKPEQIEIEITETNLISNYSMIFDELKRLNGYGIKIAIDDFGTGYSSLSRLGILPITCIKIDKFFIDGLMVNSLSKLIIEAIINIAHRINISVVAEGVETAAQRDSLLELGCDYIQGYFYSKPVAGHEIIRLLQENQEEEA